MTEPTIKVGISASPAIDVTIPETYRRNIPADINGRLHLTLSDNGKVRCTDGICADRLLFTATDVDDRFVIHNVTIGINFHWEQAEDQAFHGALLIEPAAQEGMLQAINIIDVETYLRSVVSSEMNANAPEEFLKAHAVISRSWLLAQISHDDKPAGHRCVDSDEELVRWYDREAHTRFDVCADDHCQRYQGCTKASTPQVSSALAATRGEVLTYNGRLCDARFSKCCGGATEIFSTCWQPVDMPYLQARPDMCGPTAILPDLTKEKVAHGWIASRPEAFCANPPQDILATVLNDYDRATTDFYRWSVTYTAEEIAGIVRERTGTDYGRIISLTPLHRGTSGRIDRLEIRGTKRTRIIGKELEIRRTLSRTHLYSSAFTVKPHEADRDGIPTGWTIAGAGWGHGVGLCQIGAAVMAHRGHSYREILAHYFPGAEISTIY